MYLGVVANAIPSKNIDVKIFIKPVSETKKYQQMGHNQNFSDGSSVNGLIKNGQWSNKDIGVVVSVRYGHGSTS